MPNNLKERLSEFGGLFELLRSRGLLAEDIVLALEKYSQRWQVDGFHAILDCHIMTENQLINQLADELDIQRLSDFAALTAQYSLVSRLTYWQAKQYCAFYASDRGSGQKIFVIADPTAAHVRRLLPSLEADGISVALCEPAVIYRLIEIWYPLEEQLNLGSSQGVPAPEEQKR